jgi:hypothetical protein
VVGTGRLKRHQAREAKVKFICLIGWHAMTTRGDDTHLWGECVHCGKRAGLITREAVRRYGEALERERKFKAEQAATLAAKPLR